MKSLKRNLAKSIMLALMPYLLGNPGLFLFFAAWAFMIFRFFYHFFPQRGTRVFREELVSLSMTLCLSFLLLMAFYQYLPPVVI